MFQQQQTIPQDSSVKQTVRKDSLADTLKKAKAAVKAPAAKPLQKQPQDSTPKTYIVKITEPIGQYAADRIVEQDSSIAEAPVTSLFTGHELKPSANAPLEKITFYSGWITILLLGCVMVIAYLRAVSPKRFTEFFRAVLDMRFASQLVREEKVLSQRVSVFLMLVFFLSVSAFLFLLCSYFNVHLFSGNGIQVFAKIGLSIFLLFIFRIVMTELTGFVFNAQNEFSFYNFHVFLYNKALGLALIPVLICLVYISAIPQVVFIYAGICLFATSYVARLIRGLNIGLSKQGFNKFYLFFYFCTLEILLAVVLTKIILNHTA